MADYDIPHDLLALKAEFLTLQASLPGLAGAEWQQAHQRSQDVALALHRHPWWESVDNRYKADMAVLGTAKAALSTPAE